VRCGFVTALFFYRQGVRMKIPIWCARIFFFFSRSSEPYSPHDKRSGTKAAVQRFLLPRICPTPIENCPLQHGPYLLAPPISESPEDICTRFFHVCVVSLLTLRETHSQVSSSESFLTARTLETRPSLLTDFLHRDTEHGLRVLLFFLNQ